MWFPVTFGWSLILCQWVATFLVCCSCSAHYDQYLLYERIDILLVVTAVTITKESCKVGCYIMQTVFRGHGCEEKAIADGVAVGGQHGC